MPQRFRSRGCLIATLLFGLAALLSCGGLFLLANPPVAPDALAELRQLPLYPQAQGIRYSLVGDAENAQTQVSATYNAGSGRIDIARSKARLLFDTVDNLDSVVDFYTAQFDRLGWNCATFPPAGQASVGVSPGLDSRLTHCNRLDQGFPQLVLGGSQASNAPAPWFNVVIPVTIRRAEMHADRNQSLSHVGIDFDFVSYR